MSRQVVEACLLPVIAVCLLAGCRQEAPRTPDVTTEASISQPVPSLGERFQKGETLFIQNCSPCHPDGGNVSDPQRTLHGSVLKANHITKPEDIVRIMRKPISRMIRFDVETVSDKDAVAIAEYVLTTFKE